MTHPLPLEYEVPPPPLPPARPLALIGVAAATILAGIIVGASTNAINGYVSPAYFVGVMGWAHHQPEFFRYNYIGVPGNDAQLLRYGWVGGSIWGAYVGGPLMVVIFLSQFRTRWRRLEKYQKARVQWGS